MDKEPRRLNLSSHCCDLVSHSSVLVLLQMVTSMNSFISEIARSVLPFGLGISPGFLIMLTIIHVRFGSFKELNGDGFLTSIDVE